MDPPLIVNGMVSAGRGAAGAGLGLGQGLRLGWPRGLCFELAFALDLELHAAELDQVAGLERPHLAGQQPLAVHKGAAGALQVADTERFASRREAGVSAGHAPGEFDSWSARSKPGAPASALPIGVSPVPTW